MLASSFPVINSLALVQVHHEPGFLLSRALLMHAQIDAGNYIIAYTVTDAS